MYKISRAFKNGECHAGVIPVENIHRSVVLFPDFGASAPRDWTSSSVLEDCDTFFVNPFTDEHAFRTIY